MDNIEFSEGFMHDIARLLTECSESNSDGCTLEFDINGKTLIVDFTFRVK